EQEDRRRLGEDESALFHQRRFDRRGQPLVRRFHAASEREKACSRPDHEEDEEREHPDEDSPPPAPAATRPADLRLARLASVPAGGALGWTLERHPALHASTAVDAVGLLYPGHRRSRVATQHE